ncbi:type VI secretion system Vgr family protein [Uliginosibacterium sediminicola]|uniref:Type VI secretion system Vgr family protein n=1 Tax=Uliginosibacterium sediminicola TaxID=2024550 RepID=A0ABU9Z0T9_9RHOO
MAEEGLYYWFEHAATGALEGASHTMVIADHRDAFTENAQARIRFHRANATESQDTIQSIVPQRSLATHSIEIASWDYRSLDTRSASASSTPDEAVADMPLTRFDAPGAYIWPTREQGERYAARQIEALEAARQALTGSGTVRTLSPGTTFTLDNHFDADMPADTDPADRNRYALIRVTHQARNNLNPSLTKGLTPPPDSPLPTPHSPLYTNHFTLLPAPVPFRPIAQDARGVTLRPRPSVRGAQSAIVVGDANQPVHTDRDGRIRVQFHWQRGKQSHSRLTHPSGAEDASGDKAAWSWVRVMTAWAGANWGGHFIPRVGQEVLVEFIEGDIDRPVVVGTLYNGQGSANAQNNQVTSGAGAATGNAPAWFAGDSTDSPLPTPHSHAAAGGERHAHPDTLAGIKTQAMSASQSGSGGYNQLVFDLTPNEPRTQLATTQFASCLSLGAIRHQTDNQRLTYRAHGAELATLQSGALRAGSGLLLSTDARNNASGTQMDASLAINQLDAALSLVKTLAESAQKQKADLQGDPAPEKLAAAEALAKSQEILDTTETGSTASEQLGGAQGGTAAVGGGGGTVPAWSEPMIVAESPAGIGALTPKDAILNAGATLSLTAQDIHLAAQGKSAWAVKDGIALYTYGKASDGSRPVQDKGLMLHAAKGKLSVQAQSDKADFNADKKVTITSTTKDVLLQGKNDLQLTAGGASIQISGGNITLTAPGKVSLLGSQRNLTGAKSAAVITPSLGSSSVDLPPPAEHGRFSQRLNLAGVLGLDPDTQALHTGMAYEVFDQKGQKLAAGQLKPDGSTDRIFTSKVEKLKVVVKTGEWTLLQDLEHP